MRTKRGRTREVRQRGFTLPVLVVALCVVAGALSGPFAAAVRADPSPAPRSRAVAGEAAPTVTIEGAPRIESYHEYHYFGFSADVPGSDFFCSLDGGPFVPCTSGAYRHVYYGLHTFSVYAVGPDGTRGEAATVEYESRDPNWD